MESISSSGEGRMVQDQETWSRFQIAPQVGWIVWFGAVGPLTFHSLSASHIHSGISDFPSSITIFSWRSIFDDRLLPRTKICTKMSSMSKSKTKSKDGRTSSGVKDQLKDSNTVIVLRTIEEKEFFLIYYSGVHYICPMVEI